MAAVPLEVKFLQTRSPTGVKLTGEIDASNVHLMRQALLEHIEVGRPLHLDLSELLFCDVSGIRALVSYAQAQKGDRHVILHGLPGRIEKVMDVLGWSELPGLEFCRCGLES
jgi:anti-anti-sigma factor